MRGNLGRLHEGAMDCVRVHKGTWGCTGEAQKDWEGA